MKEIKCDACGDGNDCSDCGVDRCARPLTKSDDCGDCRDCGAAKSAFTFTKTVVLVRSLWINENQLPKNVIMDLKHGVTVKLLFFAKAKELAGLKETTVQLPSKISYEQLVNYIVDRFNLETIKNNILLAKNEQACEQSGDIEIKDKDNIAVIPPLSGG
ncbi:hypothetical protein evm_001527 [Chilo suppressalis]|nr:hypothetical protein evm_001527 [Chilo suppressalis]